MQFHVGFFFSLLCEWISQSILLGSSLQLGVLPSASCISAVPLVLSTQAPQVSFCCASPLMSALARPASSNLAASGIPVSTSHTTLPTLSSTSAFPIPSMASPTQAALSLSLSTEPIPAKLVHRIQSGQFVEMRDLLGDNIALTQHFESVNDNFPAFVLPASSRPRLREVASLPSWIYCFLTYLAVGTSDQTTRDRLVYARLILREALRHGGKGWLDYDRLFRQQAASNPSLPWNALHPSLVASTILGQRPGSGTFCTICQGFDHLPSQCAMAYLQHPTRQGGSLRPVRQGQTVCWSWNEGRCSFHPALCFRQHVCATCGSSQHRARDCRDTPADSRYKQPFGRSRLAILGPPTSM